MNKRVVVGVEIPADLTDPRLSAADLEAHQAALHARFNELKTEGTVAYPKRAELVVAMQEIRSEVEKRAELEAQEALAAAAIAPIAPASAEAPVASEGVPAVPPVNQVAVGGVSVSPGSTVEVAAPVEPAQAAADAAAASVELDARVAAARSALAGGADFNQLPAEQAPTDAGKRVKVAAWQPFGGAGMADVPMGKLDVLGWGERMKGAIDAVKEAGDRPIGNGGRMIATKIASFVDDGSIDRSEVLGRHNTPDTNTDIINTAIEKTMARHANREATIGAAKTAAGFCAPAEVIRTIIDQGDDSSPIRDAITFVPSAAMNFTFNGAMTLMDASTGVTDWNAAAQADVDPNDSSTWKSCLAFDCVDAITTNCDDWTVACATWPLAMSLSNRERVADIQRKLERYKTRRVEQKLRQAIIGLSTTVGAFATAYSSLPDLVYAINTALNFADYPERLDDAPYVAIMDSDMLMNLNTDLARVAFGTGRDLESPLEWIMKRTPLSGIILAEDRVPGGYGYATAQTPSMGSPYTNAHLVGGASIAAYQIVTKFEVQLVPLNEVFAWGTGEIRAGAQQDFNLMRQNTVASFVEEAICLVKRGTHPWFNLKVDLCPTGSRTAWTTPVACS